MSQNFRVPINETQYGLVDDDYSSGFFTTMASTRGFTSAPNIGLPMELSAFHTAKDPATSGLVPYAYHARDQYLATMNLSMRLQLSEPPPSSIPPAMGSSTLPPALSTISSVVPSSMPSILYSPSPPVNYSLGSYYVSPRTGQIIGQDGQNFTQPQLQKQGSDSVDATEVGTQHYNLDQAPNQWVFGLSDKFT